MRKWRLPARRKCMRAYPSFVALLIMASGCFADDIKPGATMHVKPNSIWFDEAAQLAQWHRLRQGGDAKALAAYQDRLLRRRDAWQFIYPLAVKVIDYDATNGQIHVQMVTPGRYVGTDWFLDTDALQ
jgi:hypothetical protein